MSILSWRLSTQNDAKISFSSSKQRWKSTFRTLRSSLWITQIQLLYVFELLTFHPIHALSPPIEHRELDQTNLQAVLRYNSVWNLDGKSQLLVLFQISRLVHSIVWESKEKNHIWDHSLLRYCRVSAGVYASDSIAKIRLFVYCYIEWYFVLALKLWIDDIIYTVSKSNKSFSWNVCFCCILSTNNRISNSWSVQNVIIWKK